MNNSELPLANDELFAWAKKNRPDTVEYLEELLGSAHKTHKMEAAFNMLIYMAFDAGRWFQKQHSNMDLLGRNPYEK